MLEAVHPGMARKTWHGWAKEARSLSQYHSHLDGIKALVYELGYAYPTARMSTTRCGGFTGLAKLSGVS